MTKTSKHLLLLVTFLVGYISLSVELIVLRQLGNFVGSNALIASIIIGVILGFMSLGYYVGSVSSIAQQGIRREIVSDLYKILIMIILSCSYILLSFYFDFLLLVGIKSRISQTFIFSFLFLSAPSFFFGKITSLVSRFLHRSDRHYTGRFMAVDTIGSVLGSLITTLVLMPVIGVSNTVIFLLCLTAVTLIVVSQKCNYFLLILLMVFGIGFNVPFLLKKTFFIVSENAVSTIAVVPTDHNHSKLFMMDRAYSSKITDDPDLMFPYVRYIEEHFIDSLPKDRQRHILILGAGGFTMGLNDTFHQYTFVDVDPDLKEIAEKEFLKTKLSPNKQVVIQDAFQYLKDGTELFDLIIIDTFSGREIPQNLVTQEFFTRVLHRLAPRGAIVMNVITSPTFSDLFSQRFDATVRSVLNKNLSRQVLDSFNPWIFEEKQVNVLYMYFDREGDPEIYTMDKNHSFLDKPM